MPRSGGRLRSETWLIVIAALWLVVAVISTVIGVAAGWPSVAAGSDGAAQIGTGWMTVGTVLSPPLFVMVPLAAALAVLLFVSGRGWRIAAVILAILVSLNGTIGSLVETMAPPIDGVPRAAQYGGYIGVVLSLALLVAGVLALVALIRQTRVTPAASPA